MIIAFLLFVTVGLSLVVMSLQNEVNEVKVWAEALRESSEKAQSEYERKAKELDLEMEEKMDQYYYEKLTKLLSKDRLTAIAKEQWEYSLKVNNTSFQNDHIYSSSDDVTIVLSEAQKSEKILPTEIHRWGSLTSGDEMDRFYDHLMIESVVPWKMEIEEKEDITNVFYTFKDIPRGTIITLRLSEPLRERLNLDYSELEVFVN